MNISVIGTGYVGLVTGVCFAETGNQVTCVDIDKEKIEKLSKGIPTIFEVGMDRMLANNLSKNTISFTSDLKKAVESSQIIFLALPTPSSDNGAADLTYVKKVAEEIGHYINEYKVIANKSTVPVGTAELVKKLIQKNTIHEFDVVSNPEFLREGRAIDDFMYPDRVVVGTSSERARQLMGDLYAPYVRQGNPIYFMDKRSSEMTKYAANAFLATKITFMNEIAKLCEKTGANVDEVRLGMGADSRIGNSFLFAGIGYGGSCFPKDVKALTHIAKENDYEFQILEAVHQVNESQKLSLIPKIKSYFDNQLQGKRIALWGLAFKPQTDDIREAPSLRIIESLLSLGVSISAYDPEATENVKKKIGDSITYCQDPYDALTDADALLIATEWSIFRNPDFSKISQLLKNKVIFDGRNLYDLHKMDTLGFTYFSIGRKEIR